MLDPRSVVEQSIMPAYPWLFDKKTDFEILEKKFSVMKALGVPYTDDDVKNAVADARNQAKQIAAGLDKDSGLPKLEERQIIAVIAYLQKLGRPVAKDPVPNVPAASSEAK
jgi:cytochrome c oxidase cbb3-type subunit I/II